MYWNHHYNSQEENSIHYVSILINDLCLPLSPLTLVFPHICIKRIPKYNPNNIVKACGLTCGAELFSVWLFVKVSD